MKKKTSKYEADSYFLGQLIAEYLKDNLSDKQKEQLRNFSVYFPKTTAQLQDLKDYFLNKLSFFFPKTQEYFLLELTQLVADSESTQELVSQTKLYIAGLWRRFRVEFGALVSSILDDISGKDGTTRERAEGVYMIGNPLEFPVNTITQLPEIKLIIVSLQEGMHALSAICTHEGCIVRKVRRELICPCHASKFNLYGHAIRGPAKTPLPRYKVFQSEEGMLLVDTKSEGNPEQK